MKNRIVALLVVAIAILGAMGAIGQNRKISGTVTTGEGLPLKDVKVWLKSSPVSTLTDRQGKYFIEVPLSGGILAFTRVGFEKKEVKVGGSPTVDVVLSRQRADVAQAEADKDSEALPAKKSSQHSLGYALESAPAYYQERQPLDWNTEEYDAINENIFHSAMQSPLSTFSIDVDAASYSNVRRFINNGQQPPRDAVRIEEMINYFSYDYPAPEGRDPFAIYTEVSSAPWNPAHRLVHIGLQGKKVPTEHLPPSNLVFLIDVSGSMSSANKLPLLKASFKLLVKQLRAQDRVAMVVYAGAAGLVLPSTSGACKEQLMEALDNLQAGGSTAGGEGIQLAYKVAKENFIADGNNRVIIATDGDFNVGESSNAAMERLVEAKRNEGVFLTVLGYGMGNYKDSKMEILADKGNGNYAYIDNILEAQKVLVNEFGGTLFTIAKDVKLQVEFNPAKVQAYRLIGYENRMLRHEDFNNDKKDAGDLGSGHTVTALYEVIPVGVEDKFYKMDSLKYQSAATNPYARASKELLTVKFRYKDPKENSSKLIVRALEDKGAPLSRASDNFRWAAAVAGFGMVLRGSEFSEGMTIEQILRLAQNARGDDREGYRLEFINLIKAGGMVAEK
ncbi:MAG TPA: von Willebrand factor type A domain-containing protein [Cyclobacteriaceae bacterium]|nr:von Willebrand factor type A domain-containing protein [Flammeovirgaceae bacterium]MCO5272543.1 von Willebrand factor type A domain-containing protein [Cyclobacteriaceae bacterium]HOO09398.1 von Willebrand factor type A domain-containing protein [Cyclobacteriaceae bacterium]